MTEDECERIHGGTTRKDRCAHLLHALATKQPSQSTVSILMQALSKKYLYIAEECRETQETFSGKIDKTVAIEVIPEKVNAENHVNKVHLAKHTTGQLEETDGSSLRRDCSSSILAESRAKNGSFENNEDYRNDSERINPRNKRTKENRSGTEEMRSCNQRTEVENEQNVFKQAKPGDVIVTEKDVSNQESNSVTLYSTPASVSEPNRLPNKQLVATFNYMSTLINQGQYDRFETLTIQLGRKFQADADMKCLLAYLQASRHLYGNNFDVAKQNINSAMEIVPLTSNPKYFTVELYTAKTRMYITQKKLNKLECALDDVKQVQQNSRINKFVGQILFSQRIQTDTKTLFVSYLYNICSAFSSFPHDWNIP